MGVISAKNITFRRLNKSILNGISFNAGAGELLAIVGPNGAGKSTLLKVLAGSLPFSEGQLSILGKPITNWDPVRLAKQRAVLSQRSEIGEEFHVEDVVMMGRYPHFNGTPSKHDHSVVAGAMAHIGIGHLSGRKMNRLSGGEQQRVHLARVLSQVWETGANGNGLLLLDEPVNSLDIRQQHNLLEIARHKTSEGFCVIAVLHELQLAARYADKIIVLKDGELVADDEPENALADEVLEFVYGIPLELRQLNGQFVLLHKEVKATIEKKIIFI